MVRPLAAPKILLVEGKNDLYVVANLCEVVGLPEQAFWIKDKEGYDKLVSDLEVEIEASELQCLGILVDADVDVAQRWAELRPRLRDAGYDPPQSPEPNGIVLRQPLKPDVGVWIMPDNRLPGMLEDFIAYLVPDNDPLWLRARVCLEQIPHDQRRFPQGHFGKAHIHTWLAWQEEPGKPFGQAITAKYLQPGAPEVEQFVNWLKRLFRI